MELMPSQPEQFDGTERNIILRRVVAQARMGDDDVPQNQGDGAAVLSFTSV